MEVKWWVNDDGDLFYGSERHGITTRCERDLFKEIEELKEALRQIESLLTTTLARFAANNSHIDWSGDRPPSDVEIARDIAQNAL